MSNHLRKPKSKRKNQTSPGVLSSSDKPSGKYYWSPLPCIMHPFLDCRACPIINNGLCISLPAFSHPQLRCFCPSAQWVKQSIQASGYTIQALSNRVLSPPVSVLDTSKLSIFSVWTIACNCNGKYIDKSKTEAMSEYLSDIDVAHTSIRKTVLVCPHVNAPTIQQRSPRRYYNGRYVL